jgi:hypothetical protein
MWMRQDIGHIRSRVHSIMDTQPTCPENVGLAEEVIELNVDVPGGHGRGERYASDRAVT